MGEQVTKDDWRNIGDCAKARAVLSRAALHKGGLSSDEATALMRSIVGDTQTAIMAVSFMQTHQKEIIRTKRRELLNLITSKCGGTFSLLA